MEKWGYPIHMDSLEKLSLSQAGNTGIPVSSNSSFAKTTGTKKQ
jgi:hypothetical protein